MGGSNSKADLADILVALAQNDVSPDAHDFCDELWKLDTTAEDVLVLITPEDDRHLRLERLKMWSRFTQATAQLCQIVHTRDVLWLLCAESIDADTTVSARGT